jgi:hypothetical protein
MGVSSQRYAPATLYPEGKYHRYPLDRRQGGPLRAGLEECFVPAGNRTPVVQYVFIHYSD